MPVAPADWRSATEFFITNVERPATRRRKQPVLGACAVRIPEEREGRPVNVPCAYFADLLDERPLATGSQRGLTLFEDPECSRLLCYVEAPQEYEGERHHVIRDGEGDIIGTLRRVPPRRPFRHTWRIDRTGGLPQIVGRNTHASGAPPEIVLKAAFGAVLEVIGGVGGGNAHAESGPRGPRLLEWRVGRDLLMTSVGSRSVTIMDAGLDRRLAFAFAIVGDT
jgi:hypothetical protein